ncbi:MAG: tRNA pseudouridine synthase B [Candidatus Woesebacteria bacterium GW2011_GWC1_43_10b]|uniref:tRNA pseudouridine synthase B n=2 Tax=Candidatus Woeseibacteriota TaxID=1752722 RepID=A0A0G1IMX9_9BACT|nr:MAG: tRNA pseudouridine synthase B [Candidatus Woesebacteria bacterium GW2011_GWC1_43_10b]KKT33132.1 MAG: tRNA pseudouridine synthase B [Candidatus Woesebacteria bacterium GW2011_GWB1_44_11b]
MLLLVDKPQGVSSHDVVDKVRELTGEKRVGHAGTLDPNATGLLIVGVGRESTRKLGDLSKNTKKIYEAEIFLGEERDTDDIEGKITSTNEQVSSPTQKRVKQILNMFLGETDQVPPAFSAIKKGGRKAYDLSRRGQKVELESRKVTIYSIELLEYKYPILKVRCEVSSGTYIRALARDIGRKLAVGAYLKNLRRTKIGKFSVKEAISLW